MIDLWEAQQQLKRPDTRTGKIRALQESAALFSFMQANGSRPCSSSTIKSPT